MVDIGDCVKREGDPRTYLVISIDEETQTASIIPESEVETADLDLLTPIPEPPRLTRSRTLDD